MSTSAGLRAHVYQDRISRLWRIDIDDPTTLLASTWSSVEISQPEAIQRAHLMLRDLDRALMDDIYASRASRRTA